MNDYELLERTRGVVVPLVTWLDASGNVDTIAMSKHVELLIKNGCSGGIFVLGSTGEGPYLDIEAKRVVMREIVNCVHGRVPVIAGLASPGVRPAVELAQHAKKEGVDAVIAIVPQYFDLKPADIDVYFRKLAAGIKKDIPLLMYYAPVITTSHPKIEPAMVFTLAKDKVICGIKATLVEWEFVAELKRLLKGDFTAQCNVWLGTDQVLMNCLKQGVLDFDGVIVSGINLFPDFYNVLLKAFRDAPRNEGRCSSLEKISDIIRQLFSVEKPELPSLVKHALQSAQLPFAKCTDVSPPLPNLRPAMRENMLKCLQQLKVKGITL